MRRARRYMVRTAIGVAVLSVIGACALAVVTHTDRFRALLREEVVAVLGTYFRGDINIGAIEGSIWGDLIFRDVTLSYQGRRIAAIARIEAGYGLLPLISGKVRVTRLEGDGAVATISQEPDGNWNVLEALSPRNRGGGAKSSSTILLNRLVLRDAEAQIGLASGEHYRVWRANLVSKIEVLPAGVSVAIQELTLRLRAPGVPELQANAKVSYQNLQSPASLRITELSLESPHSRLGFAGSIEDLRAMRVDGRVWFAPLAVADLAAFTSGKLVPVEVSGWVAVAGSRRNLHAKLALVAAQTRVSGDATADLSGQRPRYQAALKLFGADLKTLISDQRVGGVAEGSVYASGDGNSVGDLRANGEFRIRNPAFARWHAQDASLNFQLSSLKLGFRAQLAGGDGVAASNGEITLSRDPVYHAQFSARHLDLARIKSGAAVRSNLNLGGTLTGRGIELAGLDGRAQLDLQPSSLGALRADRGKLAVSVSNQTLHIAEAELLAEKAAVQLHGEIGLSQRGPVRMVYGARSDDNSRLLALGGVKGGGQFNLAGQLAGDLSDLHTRGRVTLSDLALASDRVQRGAIDFDLDKPAQGEPYGSVRVALAEIVARPALKTFDAQMEIAQTQVRLIKVTAHALDYHERADDLRVEIAYRPEQITGRLTELSVQAGDGTWRLVGPAAFEQYRDGWSVKQLALSNRDQRLTIDGNVARQGAQQMVVTLQGLDLAGLQNLLEIQAPMAGAMSGELRLTGTGAAPVIGARVDLSDLVIARQRYADLSATIDYRPNRAALALVFRQDLAHTLSLVGTVPLTLRWSPTWIARIAGDVDVRASSSALRVAFLEALSGGKLRDVDGYLSINASARGPIGSPVVSGAIQLRDGRATIVPMRVDIDAAAFDLQLDGSHLRLTRLAAKSGAGTLSGTGEVALRGFAPQNIRAKLDFHRWPAIHTVQYQADVDGELQAEGALAAPRISGSIDVIDATIRPDLEMLSEHPLKTDDTITVVRTTAEASAQRLGKPPSPRPAAASLPSNYALELNVKIEHDCWIKHSDATAELSGQLTISKTLQGQPSLVGEIDTVRGWLQFQHRRFTLTRGRFNFTGTPEPALDVVTSYRVKNYTVELVLAGTTAKPTLTLHSEPELAQADIMALLLFGRPTSQLSQGEQHTLEQQASNVAGDFAAGQLAQSVSEALGLEALGLDVSQVGTGPGSGIGLGHYLTEKVYVSVSKGLTGEGDKASVDYHLTPDVSITTSSTYNSGGAGGATNYTTNNEVDLSWRKQY